MRAASLKSLLIAVLTFLIVLVVCGMGLRLLGARSEGFRGQYAPACGARWAPDRWAGCAGLTTGDMPSIERNAAVSWRPCCGGLGVPPPTAS